MMIMVNGAGGRADGGAQYRVSRAINCFVNIFTICLGCLGYMRGPYLTAPRKRVGSVNFTQKLSEFSQGRRGKGGGDTKLKMQPLLWENVKCNKSFPIEGKWGERARGGPVDVDGGSSKPDGTKGCSCFWGVSLNWMLLLLLLLWTQGHCPPLAPYPLPLKDSAGAGAVLYFFIYLCTFCYRWNASL